MVNGHARVRRAASIAVWWRWKPRALRAELVPPFLKRIGRDHDGEGATTEAADAAVGERWVSHSTGAHANELRGQTVVVVQT